MNDRLKGLADAGVSIWLDDLSRGRLTSGNLGEMIDNFYVSGVTTNPTIFAAALTHGLPAHQVQALQAMEHRALAILQDEVYARVAP